MFALAAALSLPPQAAPPSRETSMLCGKPFRTRVVTGPVRAPDGSTYAAAMQGEDDFGHNTHLCQTTFSVIRTSPDGKSTTGDLNLRTDGAWNRPVTLSLAGISHDAKWLFGTACESGEGAHGADAWTLWAYSLDGASEREISLPFGASSGKGCAARLQVSGTLADGAIVFNLSTENGRNNQGWQAPPNGTPHRAGSVTDLRPLLP